MGKYIDKLPTAPPIMVVQFQKLLHPTDKVSIKPCSHKEYWVGEALYIPKDFYQYEVKDIGFNNNGVALYIEKNAKYEKKADADELYKINNYYESTVGKLETIEYFEEYLQKKDITEINFENLDEYDIIKV